MDSAYERSLAVLSRYLSRVNAQLTLDRALARLDLTARSFSVEHIPSLLPQLERGLTLFVESASLPRLFAELRGPQAPAELSDRVIEILAESNVSEARIEARDLCQSIGAPTLVAQKVATLVSELARNIALYARPGRIDLSPALEPLRRIVVLASDAGPGIANLEQILAGSYKSKTGLGMGLRGCKRLADRFAVDTGSWGTRIEAEIRF